MSKFNIKNQFIITNCLRISLLLCFAITVFNCKKNEEKSDDVLIEESMEESNEKEVIEEPILEKGCYMYNENGSMINFEITKPDNPIQGNLTYSLSGKDKNTGTFKGEFKERILFGTYTFQSEGVTSIRDIIFMLKGNQLIEGHGGLNKSGTKFNEAKKVTYDSKMPLTKVDCSQGRADCLYANGNSYSEIKQSCLELNSLKIKLNPLKDGAITKGELGYVLFSSDNTKAEIFLPSQNKGMILPKTSEGNWVKDSYKLISWKGYVLQKKGKAIYGGN